MSYNGSYHQNHHSTLQVKSKFDSEWRRFSIPMHSASGVSYDGFRRWFLAIFSRKIEKFSVFFLPKIRQNPCFWRRKTLKIDFSTQKLLKLSFLGIKSLKIQKIGFSTIFSWKIQGFGVFCPKIRGKWFFLLEKIRFFPIFTLKTLKNLFSKPNLAKIGIFRAKIMRKSNFRHFQPENRKIRLFFCVFFYQKRAENDILPENSIFEAIFP